MIKLLNPKWAGDRKLSLAFSDGSQGIYDFDTLLVKNTALTLPLKNSTAFQRFLTFWLNVHQIQQKSGRLWLL